MRRRVQWLGEQDVTDTTYVLYTDTFLRKSLVARFGTGVSDVYAWARRKGERLWVGVRHPW